MDSGKNTKNKVEKALFFILRFRIVIEFVVLKNDKKNLNRVKKFAQKRSSWVSKIRNFAWVPTNIHRFVKKSA